MPLMDRKVTAKRKPSEEEIAARALSAQEWAARFGARPLADVVCSDSGCFLTPLHVHPRSAPERWELVDRDGRWTDVPYFGLSS